MKTTVRTDVEYTKVTMTMICSTVNLKSSIMKLFLILMLVGYASASLLGALEKETKASINAIINGIQRGKPLHEALGIEDCEDVQRLERDIKEELTKHIKDAFEKALKKIEDAVEGGKEVNEAALKYLKDLRNKMIDLKIDDDEVEEDLETLKEKVDSHLRQILEKMGILDKRSADDDAFEAVRGDESLRHVYNMLKTKKLGKKRNVEDETKEHKRREDSSETVKDYLERLGEDTENLAKFREWLDDLINKGIDKGKDGLQSLRELIKKINSEKKKLSKQGLSEILEYLRKWEDKIPFFQEIRDELEKILKKKD